MKFSFARAAWHRLGRAVFLVAVVGATPLAAGDLRLVMFKQAGCMWCARWEKEIGPIYPKTEESTVAPLTRFDLKNPLPAEIRLLRPAHLTPTFVLLDDGSEVARMEGYPGPDFFWSLLDAMLADAGVPIAES